MEFRRIGAAAFRSSTGDMPFAQLLQSNRQTIIRSPITYRALSTTSRTYSIDPRPTIRAPYIPESSSSFSSPSPSTRETPNDSLTSPPTPKDDTLESISQTLPWIQPNKIAPTPFRPSAAQLENQASLQHTYQSPPLRSSALLNSLSNSAVKNPFSGPPRGSVSDSPFGRMQFPSKKPGGTSASELMAETQSAIDPPMPPRTPMRLSPRTGRTVDIRSNIDLPRGIRMLEASCALNRVRHDQMSQRFHERGGMQRKRLRRQRWRNNFMAGFKGIVDRVKQLKNQGW
ncbi:hypothetical protein DSL72_001433 [Monilinia vaccinii-corymbosi]|uniref:Ribosomal protein S21 n=1 Tax=Monilinia vaccinii-corymbosi TaxID=61207 RepID=A0A8A3P5Y5_9HELO|nr:hypothetical protein DSL72_001433 [Monilinia vaccinii-corymbosi]